MERNDRVKLLSNYSGYYGYKYKAGQVGRVFGVFEEMVAVEWDGYEIERREAKEFEQQLGEAPNIVEYSAIIPTKLLVVV
jgi:hypothetical protein